MLLKLDHVTKRFGGLTAANNVSFGVDEGEIVGLIGPNGAGKTTIMNVISGLMKPDSGRIEFNGHDITGHAPHVVCHHGISRTYQIPRPFFNMTALMNVSVGAFCGKDRPHMSLGDASVDASHYLEMVGLFVKRNILARDLSLFELRALELARALATTPKFILIDEVMAGLNPTESKKAIKLIHQIVEEFHVTILWIEHVMNIIMEATKRVVVLHQAEVLTVGLPAEVVNNPQVIEAYLGEEIAEI
jgi:branched-chain amino acid transport system ATP-binding protein